MDDRKRQEIEQTLRDDLNLNKAKNALFTELHESGMVFESIVNEVTPSGGEKFIDSLAKAGLNKTELQRQASLYADYLEAINPHRRGSHEVRQIRRQFRERGLRI